MPGVQSFLMKRKIAILVLSLGVVLILSRLPVFPLVVEVREFSQEGESLHQTWEFVSLGEFYEAARFAKAGWLETTWRNYLIVFAVNHAGLIIFFLVCKKIVGKLMSWKKSSA